MDHLSHSRSTNIHSRWSTAKINMVIIIYRRIYWRWYSISYGDPHFLFQARHHIRVGSVQRMRRNSLDWTSLFFPMHPPLPHWLPNYRTQFHSAWRWKRETSIPNCEKVKICYAMSVLNWTFVYFSFAYFRKKKKTLWAQLRGRRWEQTLTLCLLLNAYSAVTSWLSE